MNQELLHDTGVQVLSMEWNLPVGRSPEGTQRRARSYTQIGRLLDLHTKENWEPAAVASIAAHPALPNDIVRTELFRVLCLTVNIAKDSCTDCIRHERTHRRTWQYRATPPRQLEATFA